MIVCSCTVQSSSAVQRAIEEGARNVREVGVRTGAGTDCGTCKSTVKGLIEEHFLPSADPLRGLFDLRRASGSEAAYERVREVAFQLTKRVASGSTSARLNAAESGAKLLAPMLFATLVSKHYGLDEVRRELGARSTEGALAALEKDEVGRRAAPSLKAAAKRAGREPDFRLAIAALRASGPDQFGR